MKKIDHARTSLLSQRDKKALEERRLKAAKLFTKGKSQSEVARKFGVTREASRQWYNQWKKYGYKGLISKGKSGPKPRLTPAKLKKVETALLKGPASFGYTTNVWTLKRIGAIIKKVTGVSYGITQVWRILTFSLGWSNQKPEKRATKRDERAILSWKGNTWPSLKKKP
jgi:transposase